MSEPASDLEGVASMTIWFAVCCGLLSIPLVMVMRTSLKRRRHRWRRKKAADTKVVDAWRESAKRMGER